MCQPTAFHRFEVRMIVWFCFRCALLYLDHLNPEFSPRLCTAWFHLTADARKSKLLSQKVHPPPHNDRAGQDFLLTFAHSLFSGKACNFMHLCCIIIMQTRQNRKINRSNSVQWQQRKLRAEEIHVGRAKKSWKTVNKKIIPNHWKIWDVDPQCYVFWMLA